MAMACLRSGGSPGVRGPRGRVRGVERRRGSGRVLPRAVAAPAPAPLEAEPPLEAAASASASASASAPEGGDPWNDARWAATQWTVYRDVAYDLGPFMDKHPGGNWLLRLALKRDCTALVESYHLRPEVAAARFKMLPTIEDFPVGAVPKSPRPGDSDLYNTLRERVRKEVFKGAEVRGAHRSGTGAATATILGTAAVAMTLYLNAPGVLTGAFLGLAGAWIGLTVQHCGNHGAMSTSPWVNNALGMCDDLIGGSSLMWRYHHQVSHHVHCNDEVMDQDVWSAMPMLRFDPRLPRKWFHKYQHYYMWALFPFMQLAFQVGDLQGVASNDCGGAKLHGADWVEKSTVVLGKIVHFALLISIPAALHGWTAALVGTAAFMVTQGIVLASTFAVSHNVEEAKAVSNTPGEAADRDWGLQQVLTSADWGGRFGNFMTGGLNLQVEHHLFPAIAFVHYPAIRDVVQDECAKRGIQYARYETLPEILVKFQAFMKEMGSCDQVAADPRAPLPAHA